MQKKKAFSKLYHFIDRKKRPTGCNFEGGNPQNIIKVKKVLLKNKKNDKKYENVPQKYAPFQRKISLFI